MAHERRIDPFALPLIRSKGFLTNYALTLRVIESVLIVKLIVPVLGRAGQVLVNKPFFEDVDLLLVVGRHRIQLVLVTGNHSLHLLNLLVPWIDLKCEHLGNRAPSHPRSRSPIKAVKHLNNRSCRQGEVLVQWRKARDGRRRFRSTEKTDF